MSSYHQILYHIILRTKDFRKILTQDHVKDIKVISLHGIRKAKNVCNKIQPCQG